MQIVSFFDIFVSGENMKITRIVLGSVLSLALLIGIFFGARELMFMFNAQSAWWIRSSVLVIVCVTMLVWLVVSWAASNSFIRAAVSASYVGFVFAGVICAVFSEDKYKPDFNGEHSDRASRYAVADLMVFICFTSAVFLVGYLILSILDMDDQSE